jgi:hypothetical protein
MNAPSIPINASPNQPPRMRDRTRAIFDRDLSAGAMRLYMALDDTARESGFCDLKQTGLAGSLRISVRQLRYLVAELDVGGYLLVFRRSRGCRYTLAWSATDEQKIAYHHPEVLIGRKVPITEPGDRQNSADHSLLNKDRLTRQLSPSVCSVVVNGGKDRPADLTEIGDPDEITRSMIDDELETICGERIRTYTPSNRILEVNAKFPLPLEAIRRFLHWKAGDLRARPRPAHVGPQLLAIAFSQEIRAWTLANRDFVAACQQRREMERNRYRAIELTHSPGWNERKRLLDEARAALAKDAELDRLAKAQGA